MNVTEIIKKLGEILGVPAEEQESAFKYFINSLSNQLEKNEAVRIDGLGIFQLNEEKPIHSKNVFSDLPPEYNIVFSPLAESASLYVKLDIPEFEKDSAEYTDDIFNLGIQKNILPVFSRNFEETDMENRVDNLITNSSKVKNFNIIEDLVNSPDKYKSLEVFDKSSVSSEPVVEIGSIVIPGEDSDENMLLNEPVLSDENEFASLFNEDEEKSDKPVDDSLASHEITDVSQEELDTLYQDDWDWGDQLREDISDEFIPESSEVVDQPLAKKQEKSTDGADLLEDDSSQLFAELEESLKEELESFNDFDDDEDEELSEADLEISDDEFKNIDEVLEQMNNDIPEPEIYEHEPESEFVAEEKNETPKTVKENLSLMAKIKRKLGVFFWVLVALFVLSTAGGIYYFMFVPKPVELEDDTPLMIGDSLETKKDTTKLSDTLSVADTTAADTLKDTVKTQIPVDKNLKPAVTDPKKSAELLKKDDKTKPVQEIKKEDAKNIKPEVKKEDPKNKKPEIKKEEPKTTVSATKKEPVKVENVKPDVKTVDAKKDAAAKVPASTDKKVPATSEYKTTIPEKQIGNSFIYTNGESFSVQVSSWKNKLKASNEVSRWKNAGYNSFIVEADLKTLGGIWYRVRIGGFKTQAEAQDFVRKNKL